MAIVISYCRYSSKGQEGNDSIRRQVESGDRWIQQNGHTPYDRPFHDLAVSAFRGRNKHKGSLSRFLQLIEDGRIPRGAILLVEALDRLSRQGINEAHDLFKQIIKSGVDIATLMPYPRVYTLESLNDPMGLIEPLMYFHLAYIESKNKSKRIREVWQQKRQQIAEGKVVEAILPRWIDFNKELNVYKLNSGADAIKWIFEKTAEGMGQRQICREIQKLFPAIGRSNKWNGSYIQKVLSDRTVLGEKQCYAISEEGERLPSGDPVVGYYPAVVSESLWYAAQGAKAKNFKLKGNKGDFVNLFQGLIYCYTDKHPMHIQSTKYETGGRQRRLISYGAYRYLPSSCQVTVSYPDFEKSCLAALNEIKAADVLAKPKVSEAALIEMELRGVVETIESTQADLIDPANKSIRKHLLSGLTKLEERKTSLEKQLVDLRASCVYSALETTQSILGLLESTTTPEEARALRVRLRALIGDVVDRIDVQPGKTRGRVWAICRLQLRGKPYVRFFTVGLPLVSMALHALNSDPQARKLLSHTGQDATDYEFSMFSSHVKFPDAEIKLTPSEEVQPQAGDSLEDLATKWLEKKKGELNPPNYRMVPSKIKRFLRVVGNTIDADRWDLWVRSLHLDIRSGVLQNSSGRICLNRSREFVLWLVSHHVVADFPALHSSVRQSLHQENSNG